MITNGEDNHVLTPPPGPSALERVFTGPNGIRAGWRLLFFLAIVFLLTPLFRPLLHAVLGSPYGGLSPVTVLAGEGSALLATLVAVLVMSRLERRSLADYGLPVRGAFGSQFWLGAIWGFGALTVLLLVIRLARGFYFGSLALDGHQLAGYASAWALAFLVVGLFEEFSARGYALYTLSTGMGFWASAFLLSAVFGALHLRNPGENWAGALAAALIGLFFCFTLRRTGSLWFAVGLHAAWDYSESFLYSVPDSGMMVQGHLVNSFFVAQAPKWLTGGSVGPEGSCLVFVIVGVMFVLFNRWYPTVRFPLPVKPDVAGAGDDTAVDRV